MGSRSPYTGSHRRLVVGIDVGTTFSGVSYAILDPGVVPIIQGVNRYPAQERVGGDAKIPSIVYYDSAGFVRAVGAEALQESNAEQARDEQWVKAEWFKLYLRPGHTNASTDEYLPPLPLGKTVEQVYGDFLRYLYQCTKVYIRETHTSGAELLTSFGNQVHFILTHPNGWEGRQQDQMRKAAIHAGLVPDTPDGHSRIQFVTEGEASLHFCIGSRYSSDIIKSGEGFIIVDAGGGTIDLSAYYLKEAPNCFEEIAPAICHFQGSVFVSRRARKFLERKLCRTHYSSPDDISLIAECFDKTTKLAFKDPSQLSYVKFGTSRDTDLVADIKFGQLKLLGSDVATFFEPSIATIKQAIQEQKTTALVPITSLLLVGGFSASNWLFSNLQSHLRTIGLRCLRPDGHLGKAVADGAISFHLDHFVTTRVARTTFGVEIIPHYNEHDEDHRRRSSMVFIDDTGQRLLTKAYSVILAKGTRVSETTVFRRPYFRCISDQSDLTTITQTILAYRGTHPNPQWMDVDPHLYSTVCVVTADVGHIVRTLRPLIGKNGNPYYQFDYDVELLFGLIEHKAQICWEENGIEKRGPAKIVYDHAVGLA